MSKKSDIAALQMHVQQMERRLDERFASSERSTDVLAQVTSQKMEAMNELRGVLSDQAATLISRTEAMAAMDALHKRVEELGRPKWMLLVSIASLVCVLLGGMWIVISLKVDDATTPVLLAQQDMRSQVSGLATTQQAMGVMIETRSAANREIFAAVATQITRLNVWMDFIHPKVYPEQPAPPLKQP